jgi:hypothetical protein
VRSCGGQAPPAAPLCCQPPSAATKRRGPA